MPETVELVTLVLRAFIELNEAKDWIFMRC